jgi:hypothetical protein
VEQIEIEIISSQAGKARLASARDAVFCRMTGPHFRDEKYAVTLTGDHTADQFLVATIAVQFRRVDERHAKRETGTQRFLLVSLRMSSLGELRRPLAQGRYDDTVAQLYFSLRVGRVRCSKRTLWHH